MSRLAVTQLYDGRLQLWAMYGRTLYSAWQTAVNPASAWATLTAFTPGPFSNNEIGASVCAGHSPDGRVQVWVNGPNLTRTTWNAEPKNANSGWVPWESFPTDITDSDTILNVLAVGQLADGRMQLFAIGNSVQAPGTFWTTWKSDAEENAQWLPWGLFAPDPAAATEFVAVASRSDQLLQVWTGGGVRSGPQGEALSPAPAQSTWQASGTPSTPWNPWQSPFVPQLSSPGYATDGAAGQLADGSDQLWLVSSDGTLNSTWQTAPAPTWAAWQTPFAQNPGPITDIAVARLHNGSAQLFALARPAANGTAELLTSYQTRNDPNTAAPPGWTSWTSLGSVQ